MTRTLKYFALFLLALPVLSCDDEDGFYNEKYVDTAQFIEIVTRPEYHVGESLSVTATVPERIQESGYPDLLDIFRTTGATDLTFSYIFEKQNASGEWEFLEIPSASLEIDRGSAETGSFILAHARRNAQSGTYQYAAGTRLDAPGNYRMSFGVNSDAVNVVELRSESPGNNINLNLISQMNGLNPQGYFTFTVQP